MVPSIRLFLVSFLVISARLALAQGVPAPEPCISQDRPDAEIIREAVDPDPDRREAECGQRYTHEIDSVNDFSPKRSAPFQGEAKILPDSQQSFMAKLALVRKARRTIDISTFIFKNDSSSRALLDEVRQAIRRGVSVRFMVDSAGSLEFHDPHHNDLKSLLLVEPGINPETGKKATVDTVIFRPVSNLLNPKTLTEWGGGWLGRVVVMAHAMRPTDPISINPDRRSHDKIVMIDREMGSSAEAIIGGRNLTNEYYAIPKMDKDIYEDMDVLIRGDLNDSLGTHFKRLLCHKGNAWMGRRISKDLGAQMDGASLALQKQLGLEIPGEEFFKTGFSPAKMQCGNEIENIKRNVFDATRNPTNDPKKGGHENGDSIMAQLKERIREADSTIDIVTPYLFMTQEEIAFLKDWVKAKPGRKVRLLSNSVASTDNAGTQAMVEMDLAPSIMNDGEYRVKGPDGATYIKRWRNEGQIQLFELGTKNATTVGGTEEIGRLHAKYVVLDGKVSLVTSHNGEPRSRNLNSETGCFMESDGVAAALKAKTDEFISRSSLWNSPEWNEMMASPALAERVKKLHAKEDFYRKHPRLRFLQ